MITLSQATAFKEVPRNIECMIVEGRTDATVTKARWFLKLLDRDIAHQPISQITRHELLVMLRKVEARGHRETAMRRRSFATRVFRYGTSRCDATRIPRTCSAARSRHRKSATMRRSSIPPKSGH